MAANRTLDPASATAALAAQGQGRWLGMAVALSNKTEQRLVAMFPAPREQGQARCILEHECAEDLPLWCDTTGTGLERIRFAVLKLSGGSLDSLVEATCLAQTDWRDALVAAGFADDVDAHLAWSPG